MTAAAMQQRLAELGDAPKAKSFQKFFQAGPGGYGEGDQFRGLTIPILRSLAAEYRDVSLDEATALLQSPFHEDRILALLLLTAQFEKGNAKLRETVYRLYLKNTARINNWDLVDISARSIVGAWLWDKDRKPLYRLAKSPLLWDRRIAIVATHYFIAKGDMTDTMLVAEQLLNDKHDLIHKAAGWMLREAGKRDLPALETFLRVHYRQMPRTMLRYAIERFPETQRKAYLKGEVQ